MFYPFELSESRKGQNMKNLKFLERFEKSIFNMTYKVIWVETSGKLGWNLIMLENTGMVKLKSAHLDNWITKASAQIPQRFYLQKFVTKES